MSFIIHTAVALLIVKFFPNNPLAVLLLAFLSHWFLDFLPHYRPLKISRKKIIILEGLDLILAAIFATIYISVISTPSLFLVIGACLLAISPDFFLIIDLFWHKKLLRPVFYDFHLKMQHEFSWAWIIELIILVIVSFVLFSGPILIAPSPFFW